MHGFHGGHDGKQQRNGSVGCKVQNFKSQSVCVLSSGVLASWTINIHSFYSAILGSFKFLVHASLQLCTQKTPNEESGITWWQVMSLMSVILIIYFVSTSHFTLSKSYAFHQQTASIRFSNTLPCGFLRASLFSSCVCGWSLWKFETNAVWPVPSQQTTFTDEKPEANSLGDPGEFCCLEKFFCQRTMDQNPIKL